MDLSRPPPPTSSIFPPGGGIVLPRHPATPSSMSPPTPSKISSQTHLSRFVMKFLRVLAGTYSRVWQGAWLEQSRPLAEKCLMQGVESTLPRPPFKLLTMFWQFFAFFYIILFHYRVFNGSFSATATYIKHFSARGRNCSTPAPCHALQYVAAHALKNFITNLD